MSRGKTSNKRVKKVLVRVSIFNDALEDPREPFWLGNRGENVKGGVLCMEAKLVRFFCGAMESHLNSKQMHSFN